MMVALKFVINCLVATFCLAIVARVTLWTGPHLYWFEPVILFIRNVGLIAIGSAAFIAVTAAAIRWLTAGGLVR